MPLVLNRKELHVASFWQFQIIGWGGFYLLVLVASLPYMKQAGVLRDDTLFVATMFFASCLLRPVCRSLLRRSLGWFALEARAFAWSLLVGISAAFVLEVVSSSFQKIDWADWLGTSVQYSVVLLLWCSLYFSIKQWRQSAMERERMLRAEAEAREARLSALRYQLNPHFLFNSLNAVSTLVLEGNAPAATLMLAQIGELLRTTLDSEALPEVPLSLEIASAQRYLAIEQTRLGNRLRVDLSISAETFDALVPNMLLQPLVENAVRHGIATQVEGGVIAIHSKLNKTQLQIVVKNSGNRGTAFSAQQHKPGSGIGLTNTAARLKALYGTDHRFDLGWPESGGCEVTVELPFRNCERGLTCAR